MSCAAAARPRRRLLDGAGTDWVIAEVPQSPIVTSWQHVWNAWQRFAVSSAQRYGICCKTYVHEKCNACGICGTPIKQTASVPTPFGSQWSRKATVRARTAARPERRARGLGGALSKAPAQGSADWQRKRPLWGLTNCTPEINNSEIIVDFQWDFQIEFHLSAAFSKGLALVQWIFTRFVQWIFGGISQ